MGLGMEWDGLDWAVTPFGDRDCGVLVLHVNAVEGGSILFIAIKKGKLREFESSIC
jgi:hypothetical protein